MIHTDTHKEDVVGDNNMPTHTGREEVEATEAHISEGGRIWALLLLGLPVDC